MESAIYVDYLAGAEWKQILSNRGDSESDVLRRTPSFYRREAFGD
jgi:hypothetical protein